MIEIGIVIDDSYRVDSNLGEGSFGIVYQCTDLKLNRQVAIKVRHAHLSGDEYFAQRFLREARAMDRHAHENIIRVHAVDEQDAAADGAAGGGEGGADHRDGVGRPRRQDRVDAQEPGGLVDAALPRQVLVTVAASCRRSL